MSDIARWIDSQKNIIKEERFPPYCGLGRASFIRTGIERGYKVTYDDEETELTGDYWEWRYKR